MKYQVELTTQASRDLRKIRRSDRNTFERITEALQALSANPFPAGCVRLTGYDDFRIRVGGFRIIYSVQQKVVLVEVLRIAPRGEVYKGL